MNEGKQKRNYYDKEVINQLVEEFGVSAYFVRQSLNGNRKSLTSDKIKKRYKQMNAAVDAALKSI